MRFRSNHKSNNKQNNFRSELILDTSAVIDGRILSLAEAGFLRGAQLIITNIALDELQYLADEGDSFKRARARYGFEVLAKLKDLQEVRLKHETLPNSKLEVDQQLLNLAKSRNAQLFTVDFNLAQRAKIEGALVINPAELTEALKPQVLPGESFKIKLIQKGDDKGQAVGYLPDGTMVVAENLQSKIGQTVELRSSKIIQTAGGRIIFAESPAKKSLAKQAPSKKSPTQTIKTTKTPKPVRIPKSPEPSRSSTKPPAPKLNDSRQNPYHRPNKEDSLIEAINKQ